MLPVPGQAQRVNHDNRAEPRLLIDAFVVDGSGQREPTTERTNDRENQHWRSGLWG